MKPSTFICNKVTFSASLSTVTLLLSLATLCDTITSSQWRFYCKARIVLQPGQWHTTMRSVKQLL